MKIREAQIGVAEHPLTALLREGDASQRDRRIAAMELVAFAVVGVVLGLTLRRAKLREGPKNKVQRDVWFHLGDLNGADWRWYLADEAGRRGRNFWANPHLGGQGMYGPRTRVRGGPGEYGFSVAIERDVTWLVARLRPALEALSLDAFDQGSVSHELVVQTLDVTVGKRTLLEIGEREWRLEKVYGRDTVPSLQEDMTGIPGDRLPTLAPTSSPTELMWKEHGWMVWPSSGARRFLN